MKHLLPIIVIVILFFSACYYDKEENLYPVQVCDSTQITYSLKIKPILQANCTICHAQAVASGNVILESYTQVKTYASNGKLVGTVSHSAGYSAMPKNNAKLNDCDILVIKKWVSAGAPNN